MTNNSPHSEIIHSLQSAGIDARGDRATRLLYSTDASIYQLEPLGVVFPRHIDELQGITEACTRYGVPLTARGAGSGLAGQAIGTGLVVDCSRYLNHLVDIDPDRRTATAEPGIILNALNRVARRYGLQYGPDPASAERATLGGSIANNAAGAHSIRYGMCIDHMIRADVVLADGSLSVLETVSLKEASNRAGYASIDLAHHDLPAISRPGSQRSAEARLYAVSLDIRERYRCAIQTGWPRTWRRASGYALNYLLPWTPSSPPLWLEGDYTSAKGGYYPPIAPGFVNLAHLLAGSEGTLALIRRATVALVPIPKHTLLAVYTFREMAEACDATSLALEYAPAAVELIPGSLIQLARAVPAYAAELSLLNALGPKGAEPPAVLVVEFSGDDEKALLPRAHQLLSAFRDHHDTPESAIRMVIASSAAEQAQVWTVRKVGLGLIMGRASDWRPYSFIEDLTVPVERLGEFVRGIERILSEHGVEGETYGHASAGCLHIRPILNLKTARGVEQMRSLSLAAVALTLSLGGAVSGEHGDGLARSEWAQAMYGDGLMAAFQALKQAADPQNLLNPGKKIALDPNHPVPKMDENLRFGAGYHAAPWQANLNFEAGLAIAIEQCNGAGVCRKAEGVMCPSFQVTQEEEHSTRGRANLLRALISGQFTTVEEGELAVKDALDLCLACKGCKAECPSAVDVARLKYEFLDHYYRHHRRRLRDFLFGYIGQISRLSQPFAPVVNAVLRSRVFGQAAERWLGISARRRLPAFARQSLRQMVDTNKMRVANTYNHNIPKLLLLSDPFTEYINPIVGQAALQILNRTEVEICMLPVIGAGRTLISKGFLDPARKQALALLQAVDHVDPEGEASLVCVEPSELHALLDEFTDLLPGDSRVAALVQRAWSVEEYLLRPGDDGNPRWQQLVESTQSSLRPAILLHGHCYQKARPPTDDGLPVGVQATTTLLQVLGFPVTLIDSGCCGMAGAFGYEVDHLDISLQVGEQKLFPAVRSADPQTLIVAAGVSCREQIMDVTKRHALHPVEVIKSLFRS